MENYEENCEPIKLEKEDKFHSADYNCSNCEQTDCFYWHFYHFDVEK